MMNLPAYVQGAWFLGALLFILGLKGMSSPASARKGDRLGRLRHADCDCRHLPHPPA